MSDEPAPRGSRLGGIITAVAVAGSFIGVIGWYILSNRGGPAIDTTGFDLSSAPTTARPVVRAAAAADPGMPRSSLDMMKADAGIRIVGAGSGPDSSAATKSGGAAAPAAKKEEAHASFTESARKHEAEVHRFAVMMTNKYPAIRQYGREWMSHPDLRKLNDDYFKNHDPIAFMVGLSKAPSLGLMIKTYAGQPGMKEFVVEGMKQAPGELTGAAMEVLANDKVVKDLVANVAGSMGLPPSITGMITSAGATNANIDQNKVMKDVMSSPDIQKAMQNGQQPPPVSLPNR